MALDALFMAAVNATKSEMLAAPTQEEASRIGESAMDSMAANAEASGWTDEDLAYAYSCFQQVYGFWKPPAVAENDPSQTIAFQTSDLTDQDSYQVTISHDPSFFNEGTAAITNNPLAAKFFLSPTKRPPALGRVVVALGFGIAGFGIALLVWRAMSGGGYSRAW